jgi:hypothetical protein
MGFFDLVDSIRDTITGEKARRNARFEEEAAIKVTLCRDTILKEALACWSAADRLINEKYNKEFYDHSDLLSSLKRSKNNINYGVDDIHSNLMITKFEELKYFIADNYRYDYNFYKGRRDDFLEFVNEFIKTEFVSMFDQENVEEFLDIWNSSYLSLKSVELY